mgnify:CR=1 FL=1
MEMCSLVTITSHFHLMRALPPLERFNITVFFQCARFLLIRVYAVPRALHEMMRCSLQM